ncbi:hypothetical protein Q4563_13310 [Gilvimarinus sp. 1_MG-2023]|nr:hypothetical protein [Gilvimarinus sp. 2_MG-2023]MDO6748224.1 hypothetical protein [Gilvimarinus sp. 1_MG-2023]
MIDLILELRRRAPSSLKPGIKLANPEVLNELISHYPDSKDNVTRALIKELLMMAGDTWLQRLNAPKVPDQPASRSQVKVYRGQVSLNTVPSPDYTSNHAQPQHKTRIYRGQVIYD